MLLFTDLLSSICFIYFLFLNMYKDFYIYYLMWLFLSLFFLLISFIQRKYNKNRKVPLWLLVSMYTVTTVGIFIYFFINALIIMSIKRDIKPNIDYLVILEPDFNERNLDKTTEYILNKVMDYVSGNSETNIVLSGGKAEESNVSYAEYMASYLVDRGVDPDLILVEIQSKNTRESIIYSNALIARVVKERRKEFSEAMAINAGPVYIAEEEKPLAIGLITNDISACRVKLFINKKRYRQWDTFSSRSDIWLYPHFTLKETFMILKDKFMGYL